MTLFDAMDVAMQRRELVALGGELSASNLRSAYRNGVFPWPASVEDELANDKALRKLVKRGEVPLLPDTPDGPLVPWVSPHPRAVIVTHKVHVPRSVRQVMARRGWSTTLDTAFPEVIAQCASVRDSTWITPRMVAGYTALHEAGHAHSLEVWDGERLVGGLYGVLSGRVFSGESMFFHESGASKVAVVDLCARLSEADVPVLDTQQESGHLQAMGQLMVHRAEYVDLVRSLRDDVVELPRSRRLLG